MEKTVTISYEEYQGVLDELQSCQKMLDEVISEHVVVRSESSLFYIPELYVINKFKVYSKDDAIKSLLKDKEELEEKTRELEEKTRELEEKTRELASLKAALQKCEKDTAELAGRTLRVPRIFAKIFKVID